METGSIVLCIIGAIVGAGFASGREILQFFSRYGLFSWFLAGMSAATMMGLILRVMRRGRGGIQAFFPGGRMNGWGKGVLAALLLCTGAGMTAAAGELAALTIPLHRARSLGMLLTLTVCLCLSRKPLGALTHLGRLLMPSLVLAFLLCLRSAKAAPALPFPSLKECLAGCGAALAYAGMNVMLAAGILCDAGERCTPRGVCRAAAWSGGAVAGLLLLGNGAMLPLAAEPDAALPVVMALRAYGKVGYYLAAGTLYLAVVTTLIAVLRALCALGEKLLNRFLYPTLWLGTALLALCGFDRIVAYCYPVLGFFCFLLLMFPGKSKNSSRNSATV